MNDRYAFGLSVKGKDLFPESLRLLAIAELLKNVDTIIKSILDADRDSEKKSKYAKEFVVSSISRGSLRCEFASDYPAVKSVWNKVTHAIVRDDFSEIPNKATVALNEIANLSKSHKSNTEFWQKQNNQEIVLAVVTPNTPIIKAKPVLRQERTTQYGELLQIGGEKKPSARIRFLVGETLNCDVKTTDLACEMASLLYQLIGVRGVATWDLKNLSLIKFQIDELTEYRKTPITEAIESLRKLVGKYYQDIDDIDAFIADLRGRDSN